MTREKLREHLNNQPLMRAIEERDCIKDVHKALIEAQATMLAVGAPEAVRAEIDAKIKEFSKIKKAYNAMIEDTWELRWQDVSVISKYKETRQEDIDGLSSSLSI